jgi:hypothetical protein
MPLSPLEGLPPSRSTKKDFQRFFAKNPRSVIRAFQTRCISMNMLILFQLLLIMFGLYGMLQFEGYLRWFMPTSALFLALLFIRLERKLREDEEARERYKKYRAEYLKKKSGEARSEKEFARLLKSSGVGKGAEEEQR